VVFGPVPVVGLVTSVSEVTRKLESYVKRCSRATAGGVTRTRLKRLS